MFSGSPIKKGIAAAARGISPVRQSPSKIRKNLFGTNAAVIPGLTITSALTGRTRSGSFESPIRHLSPNKWMTVRYDTRKLTPLHVPIATAQLASATVDKLTPSVLEKMDRLPAFDDTLIRELTTHGKERIKKQVREIGQGSFGSVIAVLRKNDIAAVKLIDKKTKESSVYCELNALRLKHENVVCVYDVFNELSRRFALVVMDYSGSRTLQKIIDKDEEVLPEILKLRFLTQVCSAMVYCHDRKLVHMDLKPANVIVNRENHCRLGDFGRSICLESKDPNALPAEQLVGTVTYAAPELFSRGSVSLACDVYSFGIMVWALAYRRNPFEGSEPHSIIFQVCRGKRPEMTDGLTDLDLNQLIQNCWTKDPNERPTAREILSRLQDKV